MDKGFEQSIRRRKKSRWPLSILKGTLPHSYEDLYELKRYQDTISYLSDRQQPKSMTTQSAGEAAVLGNRHSHMWLVGMKKVQPG